MPLVGSQVVAVKLEQIERVQKCVPRSLAPNRSAQPVEIRHSVLAANHTLAVERHRFYAERLQRFGDRRHPVRPIVSAAGKHTDPVAVAPADEPEAIVLDFIGPFRPGRHGAAECGQAGLDKADGAEGGGVERQSMVRLHNATHIT